MTDEDPDTTRLLADAAAPSYAELQEAREYVLAVLQAEGVRVVKLRELRQRFCVQRGVTQPESHSVVPMTTEDERSLAVDSSIVKWNRYQCAVDTAIADLMSEGMIVELEGTVSQIQYKRGSLSTSANVPGLTFVSDGTFGLAPRYETRRTEDLGIASEELFLADISDLLGERGCECVRESLRAFRARMYLAAVNMLGAACEAAWYTAGRRHAAESNTIGEALDGQHTSRVVNRTVGVITTKKNEHEVRELAVFEAHIRTLRNYGIHPRDDHDPVLATAFSEAGAWCLLSAAHRHLVNLKRLALAGG